jgi:hypothetical protein
MMAVALGMTHTGYSFKNYGHQFILFLTSKNKRLRYSSRGTRAP